MCEWEISEELPWNSRGYWWKRPTWYRERERGIEREGEGEGEGERERKREREREREREDSSSSFLSYAVSSVICTAAQWKVHVRRPGVIALQNVHTSENWLAIRDGKTIGNVRMHAHIRAHFSSVDVLRVQGRGGPYCEFIVEECECLLSYNYYIQHVHRITKSFLNKKLF